MSSFTAELKTQLAKKPIRRNCCVNQFLRSVILVDGSIHLKNKIISLDTVSENAAVAKTIKELLEGKGLKTNLTIRRSNLQQHSNYLVSAKGKDIKKLLFEIGLTGEEGFPLLDFQIDIQKKCCIDSFFKGLFVSGGYVSTPGKGYRLEIFLGNYSAAKEIVRFLKELGFKPGLSETKKDLSVNLYNKKDVMKLLVWIGASDVVLQFENAQIIKDMCNYANRLVNSDTANIKRTAVASMEQLKIIQFIELKMSLSDLPPAVSNIAVLRVSHPSLSLEALGKKNKPPLSKSAVNHRLRRLKSIAKKLGY